MHGFRKLMALYHRQCSDQVAVEEERKRSAAEQEEALAARRRLQLEQQEQQEKQEKQQETDKARKHAHAAVRVQADKVPVDGFAPVVAPVVASVVAPVVAAVASPAAPVASVALSVGSSAASTGSSGPLAAVLPSASGVTLTTRSAHRVAIANVKGYLRILDRASYPTASDVLLSKVQSAVNSLAATIDSVRI